MDTQNLQKEIQYDLKKGGDMRRFHKHIINFANEAILAYLKAGINAKRLIQALPQCKQPLRVAILKQY